MIGVAVSSHFAILLVLSNVSPSQNQLHQSKLNNQMTDTAQSLISNVNNTATLSSRISETILLKLLVEIQQSNRSGQNKKWKLSLERKIQFNVTQTKKKQALRIEKIGKLKSARKAMVGKKNKCKNGIKRKDKCEQKKTDARKLLIKLIHQNVMIHRTSIATQVAHLNFDQRFARKIGQRNENDISTMERLKIRNYASMGKIKDMKVYKTLNQIKAVDYQRNKLTKKLKHERMKLGQTSSVKTDLIKRKLVMNEEQYLQSYARYLKPKPIKYSNNERSKRNKLLKTIIRLRAQNKNQVREIQKHKTKHIRKTELGEIANVEEILQRDEFVMEASVNKEIIEIKNKTIIQRESHLMRNKRQIYQTRMTPIVCEFIFCSYRNRKPMMIHTSNSNWYTNMWRMLMMPFHPSNMWSDMAYHRPATPFWSMFLPSYYMPHNSNSYGGTYSNTNGGLGGGSGFGLFGYPNVGSNGGAAIGGYNVGMGGNGIRPGDTNQLTTIRSVDNNQNTYTIQQTSGNTITMAPNFNIVTSTSGNAVSTTGRTLGTTNQLSQTTYETDMTTTSSRLTTSSPRNQWTTVRIQPTNPMASGGTNMLGNDNSNERNLTTIWLNAELDRLRERFNITNNQLATSQLTAGNMLDIGNYFTGNNSGSMGNIAGSFGNIAGSLGNSAWSIGNSTGAMRNITGSMGNIAGSIGNSAGAMRNITGSIGNSAWNTGNIAGSVANSGWSIGNITSGMRSPNRSQQYTPGIELFNLPNQFNFTGNSIMNQSIPLWWNVTHYDSAFGEGLFVRNLSSPVTPAPREDQRGQLGTNIASTYVLSG